MPPDDPSQRSVRRVGVPFLRRAEDAREAFSFPERAVFSVLAVLLAGSTLWFLFALNRSFSVEMPARGGTITEGIIGAPRFINPLLAISDADRDLTALVYSGLLRATPEGILIPDLAEEYSVTEGGLTYTFRIRENAVFHDDEPVTADDVVFTIQKAQDGTLKSPKRANWDSVIVEKMDERTVQFTLKTPYAPFLENATIGILPEHIWNAIDVEQFPFSAYNTEPVGSGPYRFRSIKRDSSGVPEEISLRAFRAFVLGEPYVSNFVVRSYNNEDALLRAYRSGDIESINSIAPETARGLEESGERIETYPLPRVFGLFLNQNQAKVLTHREVRRALDMALDKERVISEVLSGYGTALAGPIPPGIVPGLRQDEAEAARITGAQELLEQNRWKRNEETGIYEKKISSKETERLVFSITTANAPELKRAAELVERDFEALGADVELRFFDIGALNQEVIRPRRYDALLFGQIIGRDLDPFAFWHSSQRNDPGLNIALYTNIAADSALENIRTANDLETRLEYLADFTREVATDIPAIFIYSPDFIYAVPLRIKGLRLGTVTTSAERFSNIYEWYVRTERVWSIFAPES